MVILLFYNLLKFDQGIGPYVFQKLSHASFQARRKVQKIGQPKNVRNLVNFYPIFKIFFLSESC